MKNAFAFISLKVNDLGVVDQSLKNLKNEDECYEVEEFGANALRRKTKSYCYFSNTNNT